MRVRECRAWRLAMFSLIGGLLKWLCAKPELNVLIVGLDHAGKTVRYKSHALAAPRLCALFPRNPCVDGPVPVAAVAVDGVRCGRRCCADTVGANEGHVQQGRHHSA